MRMLAICGVVGDRVVAPRAGGIRTHDLLNPIQAHYQAVLRPDKQGNRRCDLPLKLQVGSRSGDEGGIAAKERRDRKTEIVRDFALPRYN